MQHAAYKMYFKIRLSHFLQPAIKLATNKSSAVAEMGDCFATTDMGRNDMG